MLQQAECHGDQRMASCEQGEIEHAEVPGEQLRVQKSIPQSLALEKALGTVAGAEPGSLLVVPLAGLEPTFSFATGIHLRRSWLKSSSRVAICGRRTLLWAKAPCSWRTWVVILVMSFGHKEKNNYIDCWARRSCLLERAPWAGLLLAFSAPVCNAHSGAAALLLGAPVLERMRASDALGY